MLGKTYSTGQRFRSSANVVTLLTLARDLQRRRGRDRTGRFVAEGIRAVETLLDSGLEIDGALLSPTLLTTPRGVALAARLRGSSITILDVDERTFATAASTESPQGVIAVGRMPARSLDNLAINNGARLLVLDAVQDPGNVGTLIRTAAAFGAVATLLLPGSADLWNAKAVRGSMGAQFLHPAMSVTLDELDAFLARHAIPLWAASADGAPIREFARPDRVALAVGNEGNGLSAETLRRASGLVALPIAPAVESLNVAVAAGVLLYALS